MGGGGVRLVETRDKKGPTLEAKLERMYHPRPPNNNLDSFLWVTAYRSSPL